MSGKPKNMVLTWGPDCGFIFLEYCLPDADGRPRTGLSFGSAWL